jgi:glycosyltransferase involved in cell wall biosynthesis
MKMPCEEHEVEAGIIGDESSYVKRVIKHIARPTLAMKAMERHSQICAEQMQGFDVLFANTCCQYHSPFIGRYFKGPKLLYLQEPNRFLYEALPRLAWLGPEEGASWRRRLRGVFDMVALRRQALAELENAKSYDRILANSYFSAESVAKVYGLNAQVCYLGVDFETFSPGNAPREEFVLGVGAIATPKRLELAIRGIGAIQGAKPKLVWVGNYTDETYKASLDALANKQGVDLEWKFLISDAELVGLMQRAGCVLYVPRLEPFGYVPLEAAACGASVVTVREGGLRETMQDIGFLADPTPASIAEMVTRVLAEPAANRARALEKIDGLRSQWSLNSATLRLDAHLSESTRRL